MTLWHTSYDLRLTAEMAGVAGSLAAAAVAKSLYLEAEASREVNELGLGLNYRGNWDTDG